MNLSMKLLGKAYATWCRLQIAPHDELLNQTVSGTSKGSQIPSLAYRPVSTPEPKPVEIVSHKIVAKKKRYLVKYTDGKSYPCDWVNRALLDHYRNTARE